MAEYIEREKAYDAVLFATCGTGGQLEATMAIDMMLAADVAPVVHGHWRKSKEGVCGDYLFVCSACGADYWESPSFYKRAHYCPNCGAKMDEEV